MTWETIPFFRVKIGNFVQKPVAGISSQAMLGQRLGTRTAGIFACQAPQNTYDFRRGPATQVTFGKCLRQPLVDGDRFGPLAPMTQKLKNRGEMPLAAEKTWARKAGARGPGAADPPAKKSVQNLS